MIEFKELWYFLRKKSSWIKLFLERIQNLN